MQGHEDHKGGTMTACDKAIGAYTKLKRQRAVALHYVKCSKALCALWFFVDVVTCTNKIWGHEDHQGGTMTACAKAIGAYAKASAPACGGASQREVLKKRCVLCGSSWTL